MDLTTKLIEMAFSRPEAERERFLKEIPKVVILPDFEDKLFEYLYKRATPTARNSAARILKQQVRPSAFPEMNCETA